MQILQKLSDIKFDRKIYLAAKFIVLARDGGSEGG